MILGRCDTHGRVVKPTVGVHYPRRGAQDQEPRRQNYSSSKIYTIVLLFYYNEWFEK